MADPTNADLVSFINQGYKPGDLDRVGRTLRAEIQERANQVANVSGNAGTISGNLATLSGQFVTLSGDVYKKTEVDAALSGKASLAGATFTGPVTFSGTVTSTSGVTLTLNNFADDAAAASGGIAIGQLYRTDSAVKVRVS